MSIIDTPQWQKLLIQYEKTKNTKLIDLFETDPARAEKFSFQAQDIFADYSKNHVDKQTMHLLIELAKHAGIEVIRDAMFAGEKINTSENRAVLHTALRNMSGDPVNVDGQDVMVNVDRVLRHMKECSQAIIDSNWLGYSGLPITCVVNIGIGGSYLGPKLVTTALQYYANNSIEVHFVSNVDGADITSVLKQCSPETTLFIVDSKTFITDETLTNANAAKAWLVDAYCSNEAVVSHFVAITSNIVGAVEFGISEANIFDLWDYIGGRYSLCGATGLSAMIAIGPDNFMQMLDGFYAMDMHFKTAPLEQNLPVILALISIWYSNFCGASSELVLPYSHDLSELPAYLQQASMESNGKSVTKDGASVDYTTGTVIWGGVGTDTQHAFFQLLHQGTSLAPADFIGFLAPLSGPNLNHQKLTANLLAQTKALAFGKVDKASEPYKRFTGNRPSTTLLMPKLTPRTLGQLIAMYEHKIFVQGVIWDINSFDQWGVELGKTLAQDVLKQIQSSKIFDAQDSSTTLLINKFI